MMASPRARPALAVRLHVAVALAMVVTISVSGAVAATSSQRTPARDAAFAEARRLADERSFDASIETAAALVTEAPDVYDYRLFLARCYGWDDRNGASADEYERLAQRFPDRVSEFGRDWARQLVWADRPDEAVELYERLLPARRGDVDLLAERAKAIEWSGDAPAAVKAYRELLAEDPESSSYRCGYARNLSWMGREAEARRFLGGVPEEARTPEEVGLLRDLTRRSREPWGRVAFSTSHDSDDLDIRRWDAAGGLGHSPRLWLGGSLRHDTFDADVRSIRVTRVGAIVRYVEGPVEVSTHLRVGIADPIDFNPVTGVARVSWRRSDLVALGLGVERTDYESLLALDREVIGTFFVGSASLFPSHAVDMRVETGLGVIRGDDEVEPNTRIHVSGDAGLVVSQRPRVRVFASAYAFTFSERTADGYWSPDEYETIVAGIDANPSFPSLESELVVVTSFGVQNEKPGETGATGALTIRVINRSLGRLAIEYRFDTSDSRLATDRGFERTRHTISLSGSF